MEALHPRFRFHAARPLSRLPILTVGIPALLPAAEILSRNMMLFSRRFLPLPAAGLAVTVLLLSGCEKEAITSYTVPRPTVRLLAVIIPRDTLTWFVRMSGPVEAISENEK